MSVAILAQSILAFCGPTCKKDRTRGGTRHASRGGVRWCGVVWCGTMREAYNKHVEQNDDHQDLVDGHYELRGSQILRALEAREVRTSSLDWGLKHLPP